jgi:hypothetical protein
MKMTVARTRLGVEIHIHTWAKAPGVKFEFGSLPKRTNFPRVKFEFGPIKIVVGGLVGWWAPKMGKSPRKNLFWGSPKVCCEG